MPTYPEPCIDRTNYDHRIFAHRLMEDRQYLVANTDVEITNVRRLDSIRLYGTLRPILAVLGKDGAVINVSGNRKFLYGLIVCLKENGVKRVGLIGAQTLLQFFNRVEWILRAMPPMSGMTVSRSGIWRRSLRKPAPPSGCDSLCLRG